MNCEIARLRDCVSSRAGFVASPPRASSLLAMTISLNVSYFYKGTMKGFPIIILIFLFLMSALPLKGGDRSNVRAMGMGRTFIAGSRGIEAIGINPANLAAHGRSAFSLGIAPFGERVSTELFDYNVYQEYFTGAEDSTGKRQPKNLTDADKNKILSAFPEGVAATRFDVEAMVLGASITTGKLGGFGAALIEHAGVLSNMSKDFVRFALFGLDSTTSHYSFDGTSVSAWWWREYNFSYGLRFALDTARGRNLYVGVGFKLLRGYAVFETERYTGSIANARNGQNQYRLEANFDYLGHRSGIDMLDENKDEDFTPFPDPAGKGIGFDFGASMQVSPGLFVAASVTDIGSIKWTKNLVQTEGQFHFEMTNPFGQENSDSLERAARGENRPGTEFTTPLPTTLRIGAAIQSEEFAPFAKVPGKMLLAFDYNQGLNNSFGNTTKARFSVGLEYRIIPLLPLRTGFSVGGGEGTRWAAGFGLDFYYLSFDVGTENIGVLFSPDDFQMFSLAAGLRIRI